MLKEASLAEAGTKQKRYIDNKALYRTRQEINEHIFGTIKESGDTIIPTSKDLKR
ncbi:MAG: hypothetical protein IPQ19_13990 [Bacteroidetes bacterium]|nr:hypothetical protein [Bacteroidota bacterium]